MTSIRGRRNIRQRKKHLVAPKTLEQFEKLSPSDQRKFDATVHALSKMRLNGVSLNTAAREYGVGPRTLHRFAGSALRKRPNGRYAVARRDTLLRILHIPTPQGLTEIAVRDSRTATVLSGYWEAVQWFLDTGDASRLQRFRGKSITDAYGTRIPLITDLDDLERLGNAGSLSFESIYARVA